MALTNRKSIDILQLEVDLYHYIKGFSCSFEGEVMDQ